MKKIYSFSIVCLSLFFSLQSYSQCATNAYISAASNCISLSWSPSSSIPAELPITLNYNGDLYVFSSGYGDVGFPAVYKKNPLADCALPSDVVNGNVTSNFTNSPSYTCEYPSGTLLAIRDLTFTASVNGQKNTLKWSLKEDNTTKNYEVQRSVDGQSFSALQSVVSKEISNGTASYEYNDEKPLNTTFYRVKVIDKDGTKWFSKVVKLQNDNVKNALSIYPNPNKGSFIITGISSVELKGLSIYDAQGRKLAFSTSNMNETSKTVNIAVKGNSTGVFFVHYVSGNQKMHSRFLVQ